MHGGEESVVCIVYYYICLWTSLLALKADGAVEGMSRRGRERTRGKG
jgi:hypothetical protein